MYCVLKEGKVYSSTKRLRLGQRQEQREELMITTVFNVKSEAKLADWSKGGKWATDCPRFWPFMFYQRRKVKSLITTVKYEMTGHHMKAFFKVKTGAGLSLYFSNHT